VPDSSNSYLPPYDSREHENPPPCYLQGGIKGGSSETSPPVPGGELKGGYPELSIIIPLFNEEGSLPELYQSLKQVLEANQLTHEIIFINDGSTDRSLQVIHEFQQHDPTIRVISFRKNLGKSAALQAGFTECQGQFVITMDADLQDDPAEIPNLIAKLNEDYDLVSGWKKKRHDPISKTLPSRFFNLTVALVSGLRLHDFNCGLKAYRQEVVKSFQVYGELHRFLPVLAKWSGFRCTEIPVQHHPRKYGKTKFGMSRFLSGFLDLITVVFLSKYTRKPLHLFGAIGLIFILVGLIICAYLAIGWFQGHWIGNRPILLLGVLLIVVGVQFFSIGLLGEMLTHALERDRITR
jgi:glycosyltransferase involved in cell wall biosynthesis